MLTSKQRSVLKGIAAKEDTILQVGKNGIIDTLITQVSDALKARELVKMSVLDSSMLNAEEAAGELAEKTKSEVVTVIGNKFVLFKRNPQKPKITF
ncbi:MAG: YhbY family RNA-binding protein [Oscillospiraceae bacterium]|nr:YhbY family RNA-binding protein [Oscillospiraceae bacterium]